MKIVKYLLVLVLLMGCEVKQMPIGYCVKKCVQHIIEDTDEPFGGDAIKEYKKICLESIKATGCSDVYRGYN